MKKMMIALLTLTTLNAFALNIKCTSKNHALIVNNFGLPTENANYEVNGVVNDAAEVSVSQYLSSGNILAITLTIDGTEDKMEVSTTKNKAGALAGKLFFLDKSESVVCTQHITY